MFISGCEKWTVPVNVNLVLTDRVMVFGRNGIRPLVFKMSSIFYVLNADSGQYADTFISYIPG